MSNGIGFLHPRNIQQQNATLPRLLIVNIGM